MVCVGIRRCSWAWHSCTTWPRRHGDDDCSRQTVHCHIRCTVLPLFPQQTPRQVSFNSSEVILSHLPSVCWLTSEWSDVAENFPGLILEKAPEFHCGKTSWYFCTTLILSPTVQFGTSESGQESGRPYDTLAPCLWSCSFSQCLIQRSLLSDGHL